MRASIFTPGVLCLALLVVGCKGGDDHNNDDAGEATGTTGTGSADSSGSSTTGAPMTVPDTPTLLSPMKDEMDVANDTTLCWNPVDEPGNVRYRVWVDDVELTQGKLEEMGFADTCTMALGLDFDRDYTWKVSAFRPDDPSLESPKSDPWNFHTRWGGDSKVLFEDDFSMDKGWDFTGDAMGGQWERGNPVPTVVNGRDAQPDNCAGGNDCMFTGQNPDADPESDDVDGGSVVMTSPEFDATGSVSVTVSLARWFFRSQYAQTGAILKTELLVPNPDAPDGYDAYVLEQLDNDDVAIAAAIWTPVAFAACDVPYVAGMRLRITATNPTGLADEVVPVLEAAIDTVVVTGHKVTDDCQTGVGALCNPASPVCDDGLLCCAQGVLNEGVFRCAEPVPNLDLTDPGDPSAPNMTGPMGCDAPDLAIDTTMMTMQIEELNIGQNECTLLEMCVNGPGVRRLLRFDLYTVNAGSKDVDLGVPSDHLDIYHYSSCHEHYHFDGYARYALVDDADAVIAPGHKQAFCLWDGGSWAWPQLSGWDTGNGSDSLYSCYTQGIQLGWYDEYYKELDCQWIDITDVPPGDYQIRMEVNLPREDSIYPALIERDYDNNVAHVDVTIPP